MAFFLGFIMAKKQQIPDSNKNPKLNEDDLFPIWDAKNERVRHVDAATLLEFISDSGAIIIAPINFDGNETLNILSGDNIHSDYNEETKTTTINGPPPSGPGGSVHGPEHSEIEELVTWADEEGKLIASESDIHAKDGIFERITDESRLWLKASRENKILIGREDLTQGSNNAHVYISDIAEVVLALATSGEFSQYLDFVQGGQTKGSIGSHFNRGSIGIYRGANNLSNGHRFELLSDGSFLARNDNLDVTFSIRGNKPTYELLDNGGSFVGSLAFEGGELVLTQSDSSKIMMSELGSEFLGKISIGGVIPSEDYALSLFGGAFKLPQFTEEERDLLNVEDGAMIDNSDAGEYEVFRGGEWVPIGGSGGDVIGADDSAPNEMVTFENATGKKLRSRSDVSAIDGSIRRMSTNETLYLIPNGTGEIIIGDANPENVTKARVQVGDDYVKVAGFKFSINGEIDHTEQEDIYFNDYIVLGYFHNLDIEQRSHVIGEIFHAVDEKKNMQYIEIEGRAGIFPVGTVMGPYEEPTQTGGLAVFADEEGQLLNKIPIKIYSPGSNHVYQMILDQGTDFRVVPNTDVPISLGTMRIGHRTVAIGNNYQNEDISLALMATNQAMLLNSLTNSKIDSLESEEAMLLYSNEEKNIAFFDGDEWKTPLLELPPVESFQIVIGAGSGMSYPPGTSIEKAPVTGYPVYYYKIDGESGDHADWDSENGKFTLPDDAPKGLYQITISGEGVMQGENRDSADQWSSYLFYVTRNDPDHYWGFSGDGRLPYAKITVWDSTFCATAINWLNSGDELYFRHGCFYEAHESHPHPWFIDDLKFEVVYFGPEK